MQLKVHLAQHSARGGHNGTMNEETCKKISESKRLQREALAKDVEFPILAVNKNDYKLKRMYGWFAREDIVSYSVVSGWKRRQAGQDFITMLVSISLQNTSLA